jgi:NadR type nicotinamide-nucleotide adenylyltransferase
MGTAGVVIGKFLPPHRGHRALIERAAAGCDELFVLAVGKTAEDGIVPLALRAAWLTELVGSDRVHVLSRISDAPESATDPAIIRYWCELILEMTGRRRIDALFTSEAATYGDVTAAGIGARHVLVDPGREAVPVSGTTVRADPMTAWPYLDPPVRAFYARRVRVVGGESTGTTTLADLLARRFATPWVPEWGRALSDRKDYGGEPWSTADFVVIATRQAELEETMARRANRVLVCDTDPLTTGVWHAVHLGGRAPQVEAIGANRRYDLTIVTDADIPWVQDGNRNSERARLDQQAAILGRLADTGAAYQVLRGTPAERLREGTALVESLGIAAPPEGVRFAADGLAGHWRHLVASDDPARPSRRLPGLGLHAGEVAELLDERRTDHATLAEDLGVAPEAVLEADWYAASHVELVYAEARADAAAIARLGRAAA